MKKERENHFFSTNGFLSRKRWKRVFFSRCGFSPLFLWNIYTGRERKERRMAEAELEGGGPPRRWGDPKQFHKIRTSNFFTHNSWNETRPYVWHSTVRTCKVDLKSISLFTVHCMKSPPWPLSFEGVLPMQGKREKEAMETSIWLCWCWNGAMLQLRAFPL